jgi:hypothetical protein
MNRRRLIIIAIVGLIVLSSIFWLVFKNKSLKNISGTGQGGLSSSSTVSENLPQVFIQLPQGAPDADNDSITDEQEKKQGLSTTEFDTDHDGLSDASELKIGTDPKNFDTDSDGYGDGLEVMTRHDPLKK